MPRRPRIHIPGGYYHVTQRGNHRERLFGSRADFLKLNEIVAKSLAAYDARLHAFCWMPNHLHALIQIADEPLGNVMASISTSYARYRHKILSTSGHLFERRHHARLVDTDRYLLTLLRYIHMNPVKAGLVHSARDYRWSSHRAYLGAEKISWLTVSVGLSVFDRHPGAARRGYALFMEDVHDDDDDVDDWAHPDDPRVLGDDAFLESLGNGRCGQLDAPEPSGDLTLDVLASRVCAAYDVPLELLRSPLSMHGLVRARLDLLLQALELRVANTTEVARYLGRAPSTLSKLRSRRRRQDAE